MFDKSCCLVYILTSIRRFTLNKAALSKGLIVSGMTLVFVYPTMEVCLSEGSVLPVSYTHLDVYKRQSSKWLKPYSNNKRYDKNKDQGQT